MNLKNTIAIALLIADFLVMLVGGYLIVVCITHIADGEPNTGASIADVGSVNGSPHLVTLALGSFMILTALGYLYKVYRDTTKDRVAPTIRGRIMGNITELGKKIAKLKQHNKEIQ